MVLLWNCNIIVYAYFILLLFFPALQKFYVASGWFRLSFCLIRLCCVVVPGKIGKVKMIKKPPVLKPVSESGGPVQRFKSMTHVMTCMQNSETYFLQEKRRKRSDAQVFCIPCFASSIWESLQDLARWGRGWTARRWTPTGFTFPFLWSTKGISVLLSRLWRLVRRMRLLKKRKPERPLLRLGALKPKSAKNARNLTSLLFQI